MPNLSKLTPKTHATIIEYIRGGVYLETACAAAGIGTQTMRDWLKRAEGEPRSKYGKFARAVKSAMAKDEARTVMTHEKLSASEVEGKGECQECGSEVTIRVPVPGNVQLHALQWKLTHKYPKRYGNRLNITQEVAGELNEILAKLEKHLTPEEYERVLEVLDSADS